MLLQFTTKGGNPSDLSLRQLALLKEDKVKSNIAEFTNRVDLATLSQYGDSVGPLLREA